jgi:hypothetical protein
MSELSEDLLWGARAIARELRGKDTKSARRKVYHLHELKLIPTWKVGPELVTRRSLLAAHFNPPSEAA